MDNLGLASRKSPRLQRSNISSSVGPESNGFPSSADKYKAKAKTAVKRKAAKQKGLDESDNNHDLTLLEEWISHSNEDFHIFDPSEADAIRQALLDWYHENRRKLPWRGDAPPYDGSTAGTNDVKSSSSSGRQQKKSKGEEKRVSNYNINAKQVPRSAYGIWVSEIMLQQTRVEAVIPYWLKWMESFPTVQDLAKASEEEVNSHWAGLGFYRRARLLHQAAQHIVDNYNGELPKTVAELKSIPGIGPYTAGAIASIAYDACEALVDGNVCRVLSRLRGVANHIKAPVFKDKLAWNLASQLVSAGDGKLAGDVNQALMELGATYCAPSGTGIDPNDPLKDFYMSTRLGQQYYRYTSRRASGSAVKRVEAAIKKQSASEVKKKTQPHHCKLCGNDGVSMVLEQLSEAIDDTHFEESGDADLDDVAKMCGHTVFPTAPPKQSKREEVLAVAAISSRKSSGEGEKANNKHGDTYWLLVKRPKDGLLAGQFEFPSVCVWNSVDHFEKPAPKGKTNGVKRKAESLKSSPGKKNSVGNVPTIAAKDRRDAIMSYLGELFIPSDDSLCSDKNIELLTSTSLSNMTKPLEHVFSHVRHTMWIDYASTKIAGDDANSWMARNGKEVRWMREGDMQKLGVTAGVKKILQAVKDEQAKHQAKRQFFQPRKKSK